MSECGDKGIDGIPVWVVVGTVSYEGDDVVAVMATEAEAEAEAEKYRTSECPYETPFNHVRVEHWIVGTGREDKPYSTGEQDDSDGKTED